MSFVLKKKVDPTSPKRQPHTWHLRQSSCQDASFARNKYRSFISCPQPDHNIRTYVTCMTSWRHVDICCETRCTLTHVRHTGGFLWWRNHRLCCFWRWKVCASVVKLHPLKLHRKLVLTPNNVRSSRKILQVPIRGKPRAEELLILWIFYSESLQLRYEWKPWGKLNIAQLSSYYTLCDRTLATKSLNNQQHYISLAQKNIWPDLITHVTVFAFGRPLKIKFFQKRNTARVSLFSKNEQVCIKFRSLCCNHKFLL